MAQDSPLDFGMSETQRDGATLVVLRGDLDIVAADDVVTALRRLLESGQRVILDLTEVVFMDSSGLAAIVRSPRDDADRAYITVRPSRHPQPQRLMTLTGVMDFFSGPTAAPANEST
jgi:anti-anti-sigma factor